MLEGQGFKSICFKLSHIVNELLRRVTLVESSAQNKSANHESSKPINPEGLIKQEDEKKSDTFLEEKDQVQEKMTGKKANKKPQAKYRIYSVEFKRAIVQEIRKQEALKLKPIYSILKAKSAQYGIHIKNLVRWSNAKEIKQREGGRKAAFPEIEEKLAAFMRENPNCRRRTLIELAQGYLKELNLPERKEIKFSKGWFERFKVRRQRKQRLDHKKEEFQQIQTESLQLKTTNTIIEQSSGGEQKIEELNKAPEQN